MSLSLSRLCTKFKYSSFLQPLSEIRHFSTDLQPKPDEAKIEALKSPFRCPENNPAKHGPLHEAQMYRISKEDQLKLFSYGGFLKRFRDDIVTFQECCIMIRKPALEILNYLNSTDYSCPVNRYIIYGKQGVGKTMTLNHVLHHCAVQQWLLVYTNWAPLWIRNVRDYNPSEYKPERVDLPMKSVAWLQEFKTQNMALLQNTKPVTFNKYVWSEREITEAGSPLMDIIEQGINRVKFASDCIAAILKEIKLHASQGTFRVLIAVDGVNSLFGDTQMLNPDKSFIPADNVTVIRAFKKLFRNDWKNGAVVCTVDKLATVPTKRESHLPRYLLGKEAFELFDPFIPVMVENYTSKEMNTALDYFVDRRWIQSEQGRSEKGRLELKMLSSSNPEQLWFMCRSW